MALALVAVAAVGRAYDPLRLHALVAVSLITALLVVSDLFVELGHLAEAKTRRPFLPDVNGTDLAEADGMLPNCPACGLPVFAHEDPAFAQEDPAFRQEDGVPTHYSNVSWQRDLLAQPLLSPARTAAIHANDDSAPDAPSASATDLQPVQAEAAASGGQAVPVAVVPELGEQAHRAGLLSLVAPYAGSRLKTSLDRIGASALLIGLSPLMLAIACVLVVLGGRPVLVHQERLDWSGGYFRVSRFRSSPGTHPTPVPSSGPSPGAPHQVDQPTAMLFEVFLHRSGLASLPLLLSILRGDLAFVGPDPVMPKMSRRDRAGAAIVTESAARLGARPGLTGWAEVNRGGARERAATARQKIACDLYYLKNSSLLLDLRILARTLDAMASGDRAS